MRQRGRRIRDSNSWEASCLARNAYQCKCILFFTDGSSQCVIACMTQRCMFAAGRARWPCPPVVDIIWCLWNSTLQPYSKQYNCASSWSWLPFDTKWLVAIDRLTYKMCESWTLKTEIFELFAVCWGRKYADWPLLALMQSFQRAACLLPGVSVPWKVLQKSHCIGSQVIRVGSLFPLLTVRPLLPFPAAFVTLPISVTPS